MAAHNDLGRKGETLAIKWLTDNGFEILQQNWRHGHFEVDIIASKEMLLHFIEVKSRQTNEFGYPEESVNKKKIQNLLYAADEYLFLFPQWKRIQFDILSITLNKNEPAEFFLIEDIYL